MNLGVIVGTDEINAIAVGAKPLSVASVDGHTHDVDTRKQIIGKVSSVVAGHLILLENHFVGRQGLILSIDKEGSGIGPYPYISIQILSHTACATTYGNRCSILVDIVFVHVGGIGRRLIANKIGRCPVVADKPQQIVLVEHHAVNVGEAELMVRVHVLILMVANHLSAGSIFPQRLRRTLTVGKPEVATAVESTRCNQRIIDTTPYSLLEVAVLAVPVAYISPVPELIQSCPGTHHDMRVVGRIDIDA